MIQYIIVVMIQWACVRKWKHESHSCLGPDADTAKIVMTNVMTQLSYVSRWKLHESHSCLGPDTDIAKIVMTMTQLSSVSRCLGPDADIGQPMNSDSQSYSHVEDSMWTPRGGPTPLTEASPHIPTPRKWLCKGDS